MTAQDLPTLNAFLNILSACFLLMGFWKIRQGNRGTHRWMMSTALVLSLAFLISYLVYHANVGSVPYPHRDWTRPLYFVILIPHVILASLMTPFILMGVNHALKGRYEQHKRLVRWIYPVWLFVSVSGVMIYVMLYRI